MMTETPQEAQILDIESKAFKPYSQKRLACIRVKKYEVSTPTFYSDLYVFDPEMKAKYNNGQVAKVLQLIFKKAAERIIKNLWRMPFPNGIGTLYMKEVQNSNATRAKSLSSQVRLGMRGVRLKWNKDGRKFPYRDIWSIRMCQGFFRNLKLKEIKERSEDPTKKNYRGHIM